MFKNSKYFIIDPKIQRWLFPMANIGSVLVLCFYIFHNLNFSSLLYLYLTSLILGWSISMFAHRAWSHKSWTPNKILEFFGLFIFSLFMTGTSVGYVSSHRQHHRYNDTEKDPHSPFFISRWKIQFMLWKSEIEPFYVIDIIKKPLHVWFLKYYWFINILWLLLLYLISSEWLIFWLAMIGLTHLRVHSINAFSHNTPKWLIPLEQSTVTNALFLAFTNPGECWHKNHHDDPKNYRIGFKWYEIDPPAFLIETFEKLGWATIKR